ncbi:MAG: hypothetical protein PVH25_14555 [Burkholderiales bacterium]
MSSLPQPVVGPTATPPVDPATVLAQISEQLRRVQREPGRRLVDMIDMIEAADWRGAELVGELQVQFLALAATNEADAQVRIWEAVLAYLAQLASTYMLLVRLFQTYSRGWAEVGDRLPLLIARALRVTALRMKWMRMRYQPVDRKIWKTLSQLWSYVEDKQLARARVLVYDDRSTIQREFTKPLMFAMSAIDTLPSVEIDVAYRLISHLAGRFEVQRFPARGCQFSLDIDQWTVPARFNPGDAIQLGSRFFGPGEAEADIETISAQLAADEISTRDVNLEGVADVAMVIDVLEHLQRHWTPIRPERREPRRQKGSKISIVLGHAPVLQRITGDDVSASLDGEEVESWILVNESEAGYGALVAAQRGEALQIGQLVGARAKGSRMWGIGVIRRLATQDSEQRYVGIELLGRGVQGVSLNDRISAKPICTGLLLPSHIGDSLGLGELNLLLPRGTFSPDSEIGMIFYDMNYVLTPLMVLETGEDFEIGRYRIRERN